MGTTVSRGTVSVFWILPPVVALVMLYANTMFCASPLVSKPI